MNKRRLGEAVLDGGLGGRGTARAINAAAVGAAARHGEAECPAAAIGSPHRRAAIEPRCAGLRGKAAAREPAVTRAELIAELAASNPHLRQEDAELIVATIFDQITAALARGERVELRGFGAFTVKQRTARIGRNPRTQETVQVDEKTVPHFKAGREMLRRLNRGSRPASEHPT